jgi:hypothetical protein
MRGDAPQHLALHQRLAHETEFIMFEVAQAAMDELGGGAGGAGAEIARLAEKDPPAATRRIPRDAAAVDPTPDDGQIVNARWCVRIQKRFVPYQAPFTVAPLNAHQPRKIRSRKRSKRS